MKVNTSQIPEDGSDDKKVYARTFIEIPEFGAINVSHIQTIEKKFRLKQSSYNYENEGTPEYGIVINCGTSAGINSARPDIEIWYGDREFRDQRYSKLKSVLDEVGVKIVKL